MSSVLWSHHFREEQSLYSSQESDKSVPSAEGCSSFHDEPNNSSKQSATWEIDDSIADGLNHIVAQKASRRLCEKFRSTQILPALIKWPSFRENWGLLSYLQRAKLHGAQSLQRFLPIHLYLVLKEIFLGPDHIEEKWKHARTPEKSPRELSQS